jgi:hypothetical protein
MGDNIIQNDKIQSALIKVEALQKEYEVTLQQYQEAGKNYVNLLLLQSKNSNEPPEYTALKGRTWWGASGVSEGTVSTQRECESMCLNTGNCTGATFNPVKRYCWARSGDGIISAGLEDDYALIPKQTYTLSVMKSLNEKLLTLNENITKELKNINPDVEKQVKDRDLKQQQLTLSYEKLLEQKIEVERQIQEYNSISEENENQTLFATQKTVSMRFWVLITFLVLLFTIKIMIGSENMSFSIILWLLIIIVLITLTYSLTSPSGFAMWFIVIIIVILINSNNLPSP